MKNEGSGHYLRMVNDDARTVPVSDFTSACPSKTDFLAKKF